MATNMWIGIGNLTKDPETRYSTGVNSMAICKFTVAINDGYGDKKEVNYIPVTVFGKQAENCERFLSKGRKVAVQGRIKTGSYEKDGRKIYTTDVIANSVEFLSAPAERLDERPAENTTQRPPDRYINVAQPQESVQIPMGFAEVDEEIPF